MKKLNERGITLIALVITIIVLLILAGITITLTIGDRGIIARAQEAEKDYINASQEEDIKIAELENEIDRYEISTTSRGEVIENGIKGINSNSVLFYSEHTGLAVGTYNLTNFTNTFTENEFDKYFAYDNAKGELACEQDGWFLINLSLDLCNTKTWTMTSLVFTINGINVNSIVTTISTGTKEGRNDNSATVYLKKGDKIKFYKHTSNSDAVQRNNASISIIKL